MPGLAPPDPGPSCWTVEWTALLSPSLARRSSPTSRHGAILAPDAPVPPSEAVSGVRAPWAETRALLGSGSLVDLIQ